MPSEINQILNVAMGTVAHSSPAAVQSQRPAPVVQLRETQLNPQTVAAAANLTKVSNGPKDQGVALRKRSEPNFGAGDEKNHSEFTYSKKSKNSEDINDDKDPENTLDVVA